MIERITPQLVLDGYRVGIFPMADERGAISWYSPDPRCVFELDRFHVPHSLRQTMRHELFAIRFDTAFDEVVRACADRPEGTWISGGVAVLYRELHRRGSAHSVEAWRDGALAGGLYGVTIGGAFFGESMFHHVSEASKVALVALVERLGQRGFTLLDTQWMTPHLARFGAIEIPRDEYLRRLAAAIELECDFAGPPESPTNA